MIGSIVGESDTIGAITGAVAEARRGVPDAFRTEALARLYPFHRRRDVDERIRHLAALDNASAASSCTSRPAQLLNS